ncbi:CDP-diacylglycerol--glycerol-3-phosphate 3-phosphatidyltransferase [Alteromonas australica]|jgi:CDP-diacylglycerol---glycerol-3-phosphate 3-phosphatidyltransferase|uniref:CDP-diacylglycerol--glycerol-3-phosphate 3-phosphatidyltransferase n=1 Tax=Alteromonas australica TaxID=589873 RepID=A0A075NZT3_9ALTE|nr:MULTISPECIES: CDP-diacylglycerol--glycerol-3-phosphate 3-phosphatidyltransferase [Alteromonas]MAF70890.1 CDP-diacylglycerol--glycerol-3-phosphate 3-phosphatidyltransferase [Alteromonas sp.]AIF99048.1 CDP-diacylglycerol--glycerol-3-phosphate 3-phosphatidyltransferase [Alteromonas australica]AJP44113.1 CDP-diacylglycerol--glycerol-3-phosphate 3-phosphatidyltransferase [Alteromonas australica]MBU35294.1 CDP-diacylglycerol--glycerol-3-phosphate 3-phosphatidyltransferase [Alteromonas sp.]QPL4832|tara:strand:+ start:391 stop:969 length:579 start_codon:yes stop_codon:yes gene_type:complete
MWTVPNIITLFRVILIPVFVTVYFLDWRWAHEAGAFIFWLAAITDWFDGYLARKLQQSTPFGAFLDPVADKLIVGAALLMITHSYANLWITLPSIALLVREIYVSALREWMGQNGVREAVKVSFIGKAKTTAQMLALIGLLSGLETFMGFTIYWVTLGYILLYIAALLSLWSMLVYTKAAWPHLGGNAIKPN